MFILVAIMFQSTFAQYNYQNYPVQFSSLHNVYPVQSHPNNIYGSSGTQQNQQAMMELVLKSIAAPNVSLNDTVNNTTDFVNMWNTQFGYNFSSIGTIQENIGCRARCLRLDEKPVCGSNGFRYFNSCDAECDQVTHNTTNLRYNKKCCCDDIEVVETNGSLMCLRTTAGGTSFLTVTQCMYKCLRMDDSSAYGSDKFWERC